MLDRILVRIFSPMSLALALAAAVGSVAAWWSYDPAAPVVLRVSGVVLASIALGCAVRVSGVLRGGRARGLVELPLPFFDDELHGAPLARLRKQSPAFPVAVALTAIAAMGPALVGLAGVPRVHGVVDVRVGQTAEAWHDGIVAHGLGHALRVDEVDWNETSPSVTLGVAPVDTRAFVERTLPRDTRFDVGELRLSWRSLSALPEVGAVKVRAGEQELTLRNGVPERVGEGATVTLLRADPNRLGVLGPAVQVRVDCGDEVSQPWLHTRAPAFHAEHAGACVALELVELLPVISARFDVSEAVPRGLVALPAYAALVWFVALVVATRRAVFVRGRSGDYRLVAVRALTGRPLRALERAAERVLPEGLRGEWRAVLKRLRGER